jgi:hypothetical protein
MKVFIINLRSLIMGAVVFLLILVGGLLLVFGDPFNMANIYSFDETSIPASLMTNEDPFHSVKPSVSVDVQVEGNKATVKLTTENFQIVKDGEEAEHGKGHIHLYLDGKPLGNPVYSDTFQLSPLPQGKHELRVNLHYSNHMPYNIGTSTIFEVK